MMIHPKVGAGTLLYVLLLAVEAFAAQDNGTTGLRTGTSLKQGMAPAYARQDRVYSLLVPTSGGAVNLCECKQDGTFQKLLSPEQAAQLIGGEISQDTFVAAAARPVFAFVTPNLKGDPRDAERGIALVDLMTSRATILVRNGMVNLMPAFSPDGKKIAYYAVPGLVDLKQYTTPALRGVSLRVVDVATGKEIALAHPSLDARPAGPPAWSPDGKWLAFSSQYAAMQRPVHLATVDGTVSRTLDLDYGGNKSVSTVMWPSANELLVTFTGSGDLVRVSISDGKLGEVVVQRIYGRVRLSSDRSLLSAEVYDEMHRCENRVFDLRGHDVTTEPQGLKHLSGVLLE